MKTHTKRTSLPGLLLVICSLAAFIPAQAATVAGRVVFATGNPVATNTAGTQRSLNRGDDIFAGDDLRTPINSRLQISFVDGAYISLQPNSEYKIEEYKYAGRPDGTESAVYRLLKGGVRAVTGLIGKENPEAYKVETAVATIGIRGTGHNTRICQGDCAGKKDGLYHNTWEGVTYVKNDVAEVSVPAGKGVFVRDMTSPIQFLSQPSAVTAVDTASEREEEQQDEEERTTVVASGEQRTPEGEQQVIATTTQSTIVPGSSTVLLNNGLVGNSPDPDMAGAVEFFVGSSASIFLNANNEPIGALLTDDGPNGGMLRMVGTVDLAAMLGGDDAASVAEVNDLLATADPVKVQQFNQNPAGVAESFVNSDGVGWARWANGDVLTFEADGTTDVDTLMNNQSVHVIFGPEPQTIPTMGIASYDLLGGTRSTSVSGATIGQGVTGGFLFVDFSNSTGEIGLDVTHNGINYVVDGPYTSLILNASNNEIFDVTGDVVASTNAAGSACNPGCTTYLDGGFAGPDNGSGFPKYVGIEYEIQESDIISGVAGFGLGSFSP